MQTPNVSLNGAVSEMHCTENWWLIKRTKCRLVQCISLQYANAIHSISEYEPFHLLQNSSKKGYKNWCFNNPFLMGIEWHHLSAKFRSWTASWPRRPLGLSQTHFRVTELLRFITVSSGRNPSWFFSLHHLMEPLSMIILNRFLKNGLIESWRLIGNSSSG